MKRFVRRLRLGNHELAVRMSTESGPGIAEVGDFRIRYNDPRSFHIELKDIFRHKIYDFDTNHHDPRVLDCGAHIGMATLYIKHQYPAAHVTAFEPDPVSCALLRNNLLDNNLDDVEVVQAALGTESGRAKFISDDDASRVAPEGHFDVAKVRLRDWLGRRVDFLKLNIEGAELDVLTDSEDRLADVEQMVIEYHGFENRDQYLHDLLTLLNRSGHRYLVHDFDMETNPSTKPPFRLRNATRFFLLIYTRRRELL